jgi:hypothetical protein
LPRASQDALDTYDGPDRLKEARRGKWGTSSLTLATGVGGSQPSRID